MVYDLSCFAYRAYKVAWCVSWKGIVQLKGKLWAQWQVLWPLVRWVSQWATRYLLVSWYWGATAGPGWSFDPAFGLTPRSKSIKKQKLLRPIQFCSTLQLFHPLCHRVTRELRLYYGTRRSMTTRYAKYENDAIGVMWYGMAYIFNINNLCPNVKCLSWPRDLDPTVTLEAKTCITSILGLLSVKSSKTSLGCRLPKASRYFAGAWALDLTMWGAIMNKNRCRVFVKRNNNLQSSIIFI